MKKLADLFSYEGATMSTEHFDGDINISKLTPGIWYIGQEHKSLLAKKLEDLPEVITSAKVLPLRNQICDSLRKYLRALLGDDLFETYFVKSKAILSMYDAVVKDMVKAEKEKEEK